jgi:peptide/nickel transport system permease protein
MLDASTLEAEPILTPARGRRPAWLRSPLTVIGLVLLVTFSLAALFANVLSPTLPQTQDLMHRLNPPSADHLLGTDQLGRDILTRLLYGARISLTVGIGVVSASAAIGVVVGLWAGFQRGWVDEVLMRITDIFLAFPALILAMAIAGALGPSLNNAMIAITMVTWPVYARLVRGQTLTLRERPYVEAARGLGASTPSILFRHVLPNMLAPLLVQASFDMGGAILSAAGLSFIGFGAQPPTPEWGVMISEGRTFITTHLWLSLIPGIAIFLTVAAFNLIGDGLRDAFDPRLRGEN